ncbi:MAG: diphthamide biosynthesis enzyme Dph2 [Thermoprotei archaeon]|nr:diphthamide biosynthesis enzyme Dph2 [Thermoprotei archaeon]
MEEVPYLFEVKKAAKLIKLLGAKRVLLQLPEGLKRYAPSIVDELERETNGQALVLVSGETAYGPCDIALEEAKKLEADVILHYGHTSRYYGNAGVPIIFIPAFSSVKPKRGIDALIGLLKGRGIKSVGLSTVIQHAHILEDVSRALRREGIRVFVGGSAKADPGVIIGCDYTPALEVNDEVQAHIVIAGGLFHGLGLRVATGKEVLVLDPYRDEVIDVDREYRKMYALGLAQVLKAMKATKFGIIVCMKSGQYSLREALKIRQMLKEHGREGIVITVRDVTSEKLAAFTNLEAFVNTCCPRLSLDDREAMGRPILAPHELSFVLKGDITRYRLRI